MSISFPTTFSERLLDLAAIRTRFCLGLDPTPEIIEQWGLQNNLEGLEMFLDIILPLCEELAVVKPQVAFFEQFGPQGLLLLHNAVKRLHETGTLVILDAKKGDISHTLTSYVEAYVGPKSPYEANALTLTAYLGVEAMNDAFSHVAKTNSAAFVVVHSSNKEGRSIQAARCASGLTVAQAVAKSIYDFNTKLAPGEKFGPIGAVVGATASKAELDELLPYLGSSWLLTPGLGKQGASFNDLRVNFGMHIEQIIPTSSRGVLEQGPNIISLRDAIAREREQAALLG